MSYRYDYEIEHHGVKGQKWGVRRALTATGHIVGSSFAKADSAARKGTMAADSAARRAGQAAGSVARSGASSAGQAGKSLGKGASNIATSAKRASVIRKEESAAKKNRGANLEKKMSKTRVVKKMSDAELKKHVDRLNMENNLKRLSASKGDKASAKLYKNRVKMNDDKLKALNNRLQLEDNLKTQMATAKNNKNQGTLGKHVTNIAKDASISLLKQKLSGKKSNVFATDVVFEALKESAKKETRNTINESGSSNNKKNLASVVTDAMWNKIDPKPEKVMKIKNKKST